eukprot:scaffold298208_cov33-Tisochrysis_lutea.AAC.2
MAWPASASAFGGGSESHGAEPRLAPAATVRAASPPTALRQMRAALVRCSGSVASDAGAAPFPGVLAAGTTMSVNFKSSRAAVGCTASSMVLAEGPLQGSIDVEHGTAKYERVSSSSCSAWPSPATGWQL